MQLAQLNIAKPLYSLESPEMADFVNNLDPINQIAESSPGFIWRLKDDSGDATSIRIFDDPSLIVNMSVWQSIDALKQFMFKTHHIDFLKRKQEWFAKPDTDSYVMWWIEDGHIPAVTEAEERLTHLRQHGESHYAFSFKTAHQYR